MQTLSGFSDNDRLGLALFTSALIHMVLLLGVSFQAPKIRMPGADALEITLVQTHTNKAPDNPQFLAQASQAGGGNTADFQLARSPLPALEMSEKTDYLPFALPAPQLRVPSLRELVSLLATEEERQKRIRAQKPKPQDREQQTEPETPGVTESIRRQQERARLTAEIDRDWQELQKQPRAKYLTANTQEYKYAVYMDAWRAKVERVGNLNYPEQAKRMNIAGSLVLDVALNPDGSIQGISVVRPSNHKILDESAIRIVRLAAPFAPFPPDLRADYDLIHITRTWKFRDATVSSSLP
jgi:protein TonB